MNNVKEPTGDFEVSAGGGLAKFDWLVEAWTVRREDHPEDAKRYTDLLEFTNEVRQEYLDYCAAVEKLRHTGQVLTGSLNDLAEIANDDVDDWGF